MLISVVKRIFCTLVNEDTRDITFSSDRFLLAWQLGQGAVRDGEELSRALYIANLEQQFSSLDTTDSMMLITVLVLCLTFYYKTLMPIKPMIRRYIDRMISLMNMLPVGVNVEGLLQQIDTIES